MNKIIHRCQYLLLCSIVYLLTILQIHAQNNHLNKYGLQIITNKSQLNNTIKNNVTNEMVNLKKYIPTLLFDLRYTTINNFTKQKLYPTIKTSFLRRQVADSLSKVQLQLSTMGLGLKIFDAYRPFFVTEKMWLIIPDDRYAANPKNGSNHNRGAAIDVTIVDLQTHEELNMGTGFDNFTDTVHHNFINLPAQIIKNRLLLKSIMEQYGFIALETEWWHYSLFNAKKFDILNIGFKKLLQLTK